MSDMVLLTDSLSRESSARKAGEKRLEEVAAELYETSAALQYRTQIVAEKSATLRQANEDLEQLRLRLMHSEKMAKVGLLVPDIAEEIANPLSFIIDNLNSLDTYFEHISELLEQKNTAIYSPQHPGLLRTPAVRKITKFKKQINFNFIKKDINSLLVILWKGSVGCKNWLKI
ncbi:MAG: hypothetical protein P8P26_07990 [Porticoccaceae bacterium]|nr:hypothetical protein [Porticoccaceae bacterium]